MIKTCDRCEGQKKCKGMGFMTEDCSKCKGKGSIDSEKIIPEIKTRKKRKHMITVSRTENSLTGL
jgi:hypothetical protein